MTSRQAPSPNPAQDAAAVTPNDSADLAAVCNALYVGGAGDVKLTTLSGNTVTFASVPAGTVLPVGAARIFATGTTATSILALY